MQVAENMAGQCGDEAGQVPSSSHETSTALAVETGAGGRSGAGMREGQQLVVLLVRRENQGTEPVGQYDETADVSGSGEGVRGEAGAEGTRELPALAVSELSLGEHLLIWRRREGLTQRGAGARFGLTRKAYGELEREEGQAKSIEKPHLGELFSYEKCFIFRRRSGWTISACADQAGISRYWFNLMELGKASPERLVNYWAENEG